MKRILIIFSVLAGIVLVGVVMLNPIVTMILSSARHDLLSDRMMLISLKERDADGLRTFPVNYLRENNTLYIGCDSGWWKHLEGGAEVRMLVVGEELAGWATPILNDPDRTSQGFKKLRPSTYRWALWTGAVFIEVQLRQ